MNNKIPIIEENDIERLIQEALNNDGDLTTTWSQMLINIKGISIARKPRKDGRLQGYYTDNDGKHYVYGKTIEELSSKLYYIVKNDKPTTKKVQKKKATPLLKEWLAKWLEIYKVPNLKAKTIDSIQNCINNINRYFGDIKLNEITGEKIQAYAIQFTATRMRDLCLTYLSQALSKAIPDHIKSNPCDNIEIKKHNTIKKDALTISEQTKLLEVVKGTNIEPLFTLLLTTGLRIGEALALTNSDVANDLIYINKDVVFINGKRIEQDMPKTEAGIRYVPIPKKVFEMQKQKGQWYNLTYAGARAAFRRLTSKTNIQISCHKLRRTYATRLEEAKFSDKVIDYLLGHTDKTTTNKSYVDIQIDYLQKIKNSIFAIFNY